MKGYVARSLSEGRRLEIDEYLNSVFAQEGADTKDALLKRGADIIESLNSGNNIAYGISRKEFDDFEALAPAPSSDDKTN